MWFKKRNKERAKNAGKRWTKEEEETLLNALLDDVSLIDISKVLGRDPSAVGIKYNSIEKSRKSGSWNAHETLELIKLWNKESSMEAIGQELGRKRNSIIGRLNTLSGYPNKINEELFKQKNQKELSKITEPSPPQYKIAEGTSEEIVQYAMKGYELEHISEQTELDINLIQEILDEEDVWDEYDLVMLKKAEERYNRQPRLGKERNLSEHLLRTRDEEEQKNILYIQRLINHPEGSNIEFKQTFERCVHTKERKAALVHSVLKNICGYLNTKGGDLVIGVNDKSRDVVGIDFDFYKDDETYIRKVSDSITKNFTNKIIYNCIVSIVEIENNKVCWIHVGPGDEPSFLSHKAWNKEQGNNDEIYYTRHNDSAIPLGLKDTMRDIIKNFPNSRFVRDLQST
jgi:hypothetical protein